jgi:succinate-semialdehyde dehydrogenase/glutarate-semialdehyde dehydrogenase
LLPIVTRTVEHRRPIGVVAVITPWNYPFTLPASDAIPALLAGNAVVLLPDLLTQDTAELVVKLFREAGVPDGLVGLVRGGGRDHGDALVDAVDFVTFTGSTETGRRVATRAASRLIGFTGELGGKNPMLVLDDADVAKAAFGAVRTCFANSGQLCVSVERIYVVARHFDQFLREFAEHTNAMSLGAGAAWEIDMGPLITEAHAARVMAHIDDAVARGATLVAGGHRRPDLAPTFVEPTILTAVPPEATLAREETFGPVVSVYRVANDAEAFARANDSEFGLNASVWTKRPRRITDQVAAGTVTINEGYASSWASHGAPLGGVKQSGMGRRHGVEGLLAYTEAQSIATQRLFGITPFPGQSNRGFARLIGAVFAFLNRVS